MLLQTRRTLIAIQCHVKRELRLSSPFSLLRLNLKNNHQHTKSLNCNNFQALKPSVNQSTKFSNGSNFLVINNKAIHTTPKRYNPILSILLRNVAKIATIYAGRSARNWWKSRTPEEQAQVRSFIGRHRWKLVVPFLATIFGSFVYYYSNIEETPITKRRRFVAFTKEQFEVISNLETETNIQMYHEKLLPKDNPLTRRVGGVVKEILVKNNDLAMIAENEWAVSVIKDDNNINAFVLPSGQIFVFSGLLKICDNDDQLGIVLAHEISHAILLHGIEMMSHAHIVDIIFIALIGVLWMYLPTDFLAIIMTAFSRLVLRIGLDAPYSRMLETEADEVGLQLAAKACFDVREASIFWEKMNMIEREVSVIPQLDVDVEFLMTHPTHERRAENLNAMLDKVMKIRECAKCKPLPPLNMSKRLAAEKDKISKMINEKNYEGVLKIGDL